MRLSGGEGPWGPRHCRPWKPLQPEPRCGPAHSWHEYGTVTPGNGLALGRGRTSTSLSQDKTREKQIPPDKPEVQTQPPLRKRLPEPTSEAAEAQRKTAASQALAATSSPTTSQWKRTWCRWVRGLPAPREPSARTPHQHTRTRVHTCTHTNARTHTHPHTNTHARTHASTHKYATTHAPTNARAHTPPTHGHTNTSTQAQTRAHSSSSAPGPHAPGEKREGASTFPGKEVSGRSGEREMPRPRRQWI